MSAAGELEEALRRCGKKIIIASAASGIPYYRANLREGIALVIGNEGNGISPEIAGIADECVNLPMKGGVESLNAAVAAAVLMYEAVRE